MVPRVGDGDPSFPVHPTQHEHNNIIIIIGIFVGSVKNASLYTNMARRYSVTGPTRTLIISMYMADYHILQFIRSVYKIVLLKYCLQSVSVTLTMSNAHWDQTESILALSYNKHVFHQ